MHRYLPYFAVTLLAAACTNGIQGGEYGKDNGSGSAPSTTGGPVAIDPVTGEPVVGSPTDTTDSAASTGNTSGGTAGPSTGGPGTSSGSDPTVPETPLANCDT